MLVFLLQDGKNGGALIGNMKIYKAKGNNDFEIGESESFDPSLVKLKISMITPSSADIALYEGKVNIQYPIVPCHMATAVVSEDREEYGLKRGARVLLNPYELSSMDREGLCDVKVRGLDSDGFLRDFLSLPVDNIIPFPEDVKETEAIFLEVLAVALAAVGSMKLEKGEYVAVVGGSVLSNLIAQLAQYYQAIPIYISNDKRHLEIAEKCGIYYTVDEAAEDPYQRVMNITGGRMAEHTVLHAKAGVSPHFLFSLAGRGGDCQIVSVNTSIPRMETNVSLISKKQLTVTGLSHGADEISAAVNILAQRQLDFSHFIDKTVPFEETQALFDELSADPIRYVCPVIKV